MLLGLCIISEQGFVNADEYMEILYDGFLDFEGLWGAAGDCVDSNSLVLEGLRWAW